MADGKQSSERVQDAAQTIHELRAQRREELPRDERAVESFMHGVGRPRTIAIVVAFVVIWVALNVLLRPHHQTFDDTPFALLNLISQLLSLMLVIGVLSAQNTQSTIDQERARLMLQLAIVQDKKISEVLEMLGARDQSRRPTNLHEAAEALKEAERQETEKQEQSPKS